MLGKPIQWVLLVAAALRLVYLYQIQGTPPGDALLIDSEYYHLEALRIVGGDWLGDRVFFMNPFYPYFLALIYVLLGESTLWVGLVQVGMGTALCWFVYAIGHTLWGERVGLLAAALLAGYGVLIFYDGALLTASPIGFLNLFALYLLIGRGEATPVRCLSAGLLLGLSTAARPSVMLFAVFLLLWFYVEGRYRLLKQGLLLWCGILLIVLPVVLRNYALGGEWGLTTSSAGMNFYVGNHQQATGIYAQVPFLTSAEPDRERDEFVREAERRCQCDLGPSGASRYWLMQGLEFIRSQPLDYASLLLRKVYMFVNRVESQNNLSFYFTRDFAPVLHWVKAGWWLVLPMGLGGLIFCRSARCPVLELYLLSYLAACLLFFVSSEYRLPAAPALALYAARFMLDGVERARKSGVPSLGSRLVLLVAFMVPVLYVDSDAARLMLRRVDYYNYGVLYERRGDRNIAAALFAQSLQIDPAFRPARAAADRLQAGASRRDNWMEEGSRAYANGDYEHARDLYLNAVEKGNVQPEIFNNLGLAHYKLGDLSAAEAAFEEALARREEYVKAYYNLALVCIANGALARADSLLDKALEGEPNYGQALYKSGELAAIAGDTARALSRWENLLSLVGQDETLRSKIDSLKGIAR